MVNYEQILSARVKEVQPSGIRRFFELAAKMPHAISLGVGEPDFETPWQIRRAGIQSLEKGQTFYTSNWGLAELRNQIAALVRRKYRLCYDADKEILVTVGGSEAIDNTIRAIVNVGDEVLIPEPSFVCYKPLTQMAGGVPVPLPTRAEDQFKLTADSLRAAITPRTKLLILPYPNNPTGAAYDRAGLKAWVDYANKQNAVILYDAAYECFIEDETLPRSIYEIEGAKTCAIEFCSFSKMAGFTGTRCGWTVVPTALLDGKLNKMWLRRQTTKFNGVPYIVQRGAAACFTEEGMKQIKETLGYYKQNAKVLAATLDELGIWYTGGKSSPYLWLKCPNGMDSWTFFDYLLENANVVGTPGAGFGKNGDGFFRLTAFGDQKRTLEAAERLKKLLAK